MRSVIILFPALFVMCGWAQEASTIDYFSCGLKRVVDEASMMVGFENKKGVVVLPAKYCMADRFVKNKCAVCMHSQWVDMSSTDGAEESKWIGGYWGIIDRKGTFLKSCSYERIWNEERGCFQYQSLSDTFLFSNKGKLIPLK